MVETFLYPKLRGRIIEKYRTYVNFGKAINEEQSVITRKLGGKIGLTRKDIITWAKALDLDLADYGEYFFGDEVYQSLTNDENQ